MTAGKSATRKQHVMIESCSLLCVVAVSNRVHTGETNPSHKHKLGASSGVAVSRDKVSLSRDFRCPFPPGVYSFG